MPAHVVTIGRRTRVRPGREADYSRIHANIPAAVEDALRRCGVVRWHIWSDGGTLFHSIDTSGGYDRFLQEITALGTVDGPWDELIDSLLESDPASDQILPLVWAMNENGQHSGQER